MRRTWVLPVMLLILAACGTDTGGGTIASSSVGTTTTASIPTTTRPRSTTTTGSDFPITVEADNGSVTIEQAPEAIISLSSTATEMLYAIGAGPQVAAVDEQSNYPSEAPKTDLSGYTPNIEALLSYAPDLVVIGFDPGDLVATLNAAGVPVLFLNAAATIDDTYRQIEVLGAASGHEADAISLNQSIEANLGRAIENAPDVPSGTDYYHEVDNNFYSATSTTFIGQIYAMFGLTNIADAADEGGSSFGYPQLSSEYIVAADPDLIFLADTFYGESIETVADRPGWGVLTAVRAGNVIELDSDVVSRWGPRVVDFAESISGALDRYASES